MAVLVPFPEFSNKPNSTTTNSTTNSTTTPEPTTTTTTTSLNSSWQEQARAMPDVMAVIGSNAILAIKLVRERLGIGLKDAKDTVDAIRNG